VASPSARFKYAPSDEPAGNVLIQYPEEGMTVRDLDTVKPDSGHVGTRKK